MRPRAWMVLTAGLALAAGAQKQDSAAADRVKLQGTWVPIFAERNGRPSEEFKRFTFTFDGDTLIIKKSPEESREGTFKLDSTTTPRQITILPVDFKHTLKGIYAFDGDNLKLCLGDLGKDRPTEFATRQGSQSVLIILKREKP
ncbi:MAG TPA: TIGR03067 domain-containing protein [Gemmataceae bacterium]|nr:TIGR03067 domain-containing protein [Gemmataceae bacterium]